jgi:group I intron endonuclease
MGYIYLIKNKIDEKKYVGQTVENNINNRWKSHFKKGSNCRYLKHALQKYGKHNFTFQIICICFDNDCDKYENEYMKKFNTIVPNGYNLREAGNHGHHNEETKQKIKDSIHLYLSNLSIDDKKIISDRHKGQKNSNYGKKMSKEEKEKLSILMKEKWKNNLISNTHVIRKKISCYSLDNDFIETYSSMTEASLKLNITLQEISMVCNNKRKTAKSFIFKFVK